MEEEPLKPILYTSTVQQHNNVEYVESIAQRCIDQS